MRRGLAADCGHEAKSPQGGGAVMGTRPNPHRAAFSMQSVGTRPNPHRAAISMVKSPQSGHQHALAQALISMLAIRLTCGNETKSPQSNVPSSPRDTLSASQALNIDDWNAER